MTCANGSLTTSVNNFGVCFTFNSGESHPILTSKRPGIVQKPRGEVTKSISPVLMFSIIFFRIVKTLVTYGMKLSSATVAPVKNERNFGD